MKRVGVLSLFLIKNLFRSLLGVLPPVLTLLIYRLTFTYRDAGDPAYLTAVAGLGLAFVTWVTVLLMADRANRAAMYPLLARLPNRAELLAAVVGSTLLTMLAMATLYLGLVLGLHHMTLSLQDLLLIATRWLILFLFTAALGLHMSRLVSRGGSYVLAYAVLALMAVVKEQERYLGKGEQSWSINVVALVVRPITDTLTIALHAAPEQIIPALAFTLVYAGILFTLAVWLFHQKDLLWVE